jgi:hypothetical protein
LTQREAIEFGKLPFKSFTVSKEGTGVLFGERKLSLDLSPRFPCLRDVLAQRLVGTMGVNHIPLVFRSKQALVRMLSMNINEMLAYLTQLGDGHG